MNTFAAAQQKNMLQTTENGGMLEDRIVILDAGSQYGKVRIWCVPFMLIETNMWIN